MSETEFGRFHRAVFFSSTILLLCWSGLASSLSAQDSKQRQLNQFRTQRQESLKSLRFEINQIADSCHKDGLTDAAQDLTALGLQLADLSWQPQVSNFAQLPVNASLPREQKLWRIQLREVRSDKAKSQYMLARRILRAGFPSLAYDVVKDVLKLDPDHKLARGVMGLQFYRDRLRNDDPTYAGEWLSGWEVGKRSGSRPEVDHPIYGWIPTRHVKRYEDGERPWGAGWVSVDKEAELRRRFRNGWEIESEHFTIKTNTSREEGVQLSRKLEIFHDWMKANFASFFDTPKDLAERFEQTTSRRRTVRKPMKIHLYADRNEYEQTVRALANPGFVNNGLYWEDTATCYLYRSEDGKLDTAYHEATHQILDIATLKDRFRALQKARMINRRAAGQRWVIGRNRNFWVLEGIGCYMESFHIQDGGMIQVGDPMHIRFLGAQQRLLKDNFYVDLRSLSSLGRDTFRSHPNHTQLYTQGSGLVHFLMHYEGGIYRDALIQLLHDMYRPDLNNLAKDPALDELTGVSFDELDLQYREHMRALNEMVIQRLANP